MPIQFPQPTQDNPFDRWKWKQGAKCPSQQIQPNLGRPGVRFNEDTLNPGLSQPKTILSNLFNLTNVNGAVVNPAPIDTTAIYDSACRRTFYRVMGHVGALLSGSSRDSTGAVLGNCRVMVFSTQDMIFVGETTSDDNGQWSLPIPLLFGGPFFLVEYKAGTPDVAGTSVNTLLPDAV